MFLSFQVTFTTERGRNRKWRPKRESQILNRSLNCHRRRRRSPAPCRLKGLKTQQPFVPQVHANHENHNTSLPAFKPCQQVTPFQLWSLRWSSCRYIGYSNRIHGHVCTVFHLARNGSTLSYIYAQITNTTYPIFIKKNPKHSLKYNFMNQTTSTE